MNLWIESNLGADILDLQWRARNGLSQLGAIPDPAAKILLERLGFGIEKNITFNEDNRLQALQSCWFDQECLRFFEEHPKALVIELGAGFSTRFHRLSSVLDWPRFRWLILDEQKVISKIQTVFPRIDNFELKCWRDSNDWLEEWQGESIMILVEQKTIKMSVADIKRFCHNLQYQSKKWISSCHLEVHFFDERFVHLSWLQKLKHWCLPNRFVACIKLIVE
ncbi:MAG: hypothetical protein IPK77_00495 [Cellvibrio sp.]|nr:hypothetical protein [Cellvibrio sp.]